MLCDHDGVQGVDRETGGFFLIGGVLLFFDRAM
jgi:hypothetical protein